MYENWYLMEKNWEAVRNDFLREAKCNRQVDEALLVKQQNQKAESTNGFLGQVRRLLHVPGFN